MSSSISPPASEQASVSSEAPEESSTTHICRKCKASFPTGNALHQHIALCGKQQHGQQHCRCAAVEQQLEEIKGLLADLLASKDQRQHPASLDFQAFTECIKLEHESLLDYVRRLREVYLSLPIRVQYQQAVRWQLYEHFSTFMPKVFAAGRDYLDSCSSTLKVFWEIEAHLERKELGYSTIGVRGWAS